jgi:hypothetical protein
MICVPGHTLALAGACGHVEPVPGPAPGEAGGDDPVGQGVAERCRRGERLPLVLHKTRIGARVMDAMLSDLYRLPTT